MKSVFFKISCIFFLTLLPFNLLSQVKIDVMIDDINDTILYLLKYKSDKTQIIVDSSSISSKNKVFSGNTNYDEGIYVLADSKQQPLFEILLGKDQKFSIHIEELMDLNAYKIMGCKETKDYFKVYSKTVHSKLYIKALESEIKYYPDNVRKIDSVENELREYQESMLSKDKNSFLNTYIKSIEKVIVPKDVKHVEKYIIEHYFDNIPLCDTRILNSRLLKNKLDDFFSNYMKLQSPVYISEQIDNLILKTNDCHEVRDYILWYLYSRFFNTDNVDDEFVFIHLVDKYFSTLDIKNLTDNIRNEIVKRANVLRGITIGQTAPHFSFIDDNGNDISFDCIDSKYTVLFFYKPDCQKCIRDKRILELVKKRQKDLTILYINISEDNHSNVSQDILLQYDIMTTPTIYLLNENKEIIAKHINVEEIEFYIIKR